jgi:hypothetical protein
VLHVTAAGFNVPSAEPPTLQYSAILAIIDRIKARSVSPRDGDGAAKVAWRFAAYGPSSTQTWKGCAEAQKSGDQFLKIRSRELSAGLKRRDEFGKLSCEPQASLSAVPELRDVVAHS